MRYSSQEIKSFPGKESVQKDRAYWFANNLRTFCGIALAWASCAIADWVMIWFRVNVASSFAISASRMVDSAEVMFSEAIRRLVRLLSKVFLWKVT